MGANLTGANLSEANMILAGLGGADLRGADLSGSDLTSVVYNGKTKCDDETIWPEGFSCSEEGTVLQD